MKNLAWLLPALALALHARAAESPSDDIPSLAGELPRAKPARRGLLDLIKTAVNEGQDANINPDTAELLGLRRDLRVRVIRYRPWISPDRLDHAFQVAYRPREDGAVEPIGVVLEVTRVTLNASMKYIDRTAMLLTLDGTLEKAAATEGRFKKIQHEPVPVGSVQDLYKSELDFYEVRSLGLEMER